MRGNGNALHLLCGRENSLEYAAHHRLDGSEHVVLRDEAHLDIELVELARRTVGARVFIAEAGRNLEVTVEARHHEELLEHLRRLRQRIEPAGMQAARHEVIARALRAVGVRIGVWNSMKPCSIMRRRRLAMTWLRSMMFLCSLLRRRSRKRYLSRSSSGVRVVLAARGLAGSRPSTGRPSPRRRARLAGGEPGVHRGRRGDHLAAHRDHALRAHRLGGLERPGWNVDHHLGHAVVIAQVDEQQIASGLALRWTQPDRRACWPTCSGRNWPHVWVR